VRSLLRPVAGISIVFACLAFALQGCTKVKDQWPDKPGPKILTSFAPLYCFAKNVAGEDASVLHVMSDTGPHEFDPQAEDAAALTRADLFIINGLGLDDQIAENLVRSSGNKNVKVVKVGEAVPVNDLHEGGEEDEHDKDRGKKEEKEHAAHGHGRYDPHVWQIGRASCRERV
jgi:zinc transport system substrate-binding protein